MSDGYIGGSVNYVGELQVGSPSSLLDDSETRAAILGLDEHEEDVRGSGTIGNVLIDQPLVVVLLFEEWAPDFEEGRNDDLYQLVDAAAAPADDSETRVFVEDTLAELGEEEIQPFDQRVEDSVEFASVVFEDSTDAVEEVEVVYEQVIEFVADVATSVEVLFDGREDDEWYEEIAQQLVEDVAPPVDELETRVWFDDEREDESDIRASGAIGNLLQDGPLAEIEPIFIEQYEDIPELVEYALYQQAIDPPPAPPADDSEIRVLLDDVREREELGEHQGNALGFSVDEIFYIAQELLQDIQDEVEWVEEQLQQLIENPPADLFETRAFVEEQWQPEEWVEDVIQQLIEDAVVPPPDDAETRVFLDDAAQEEELTVEEILTQLVEDAAVVEDYETRVYVEEVETAEDETAFLVFLDQIIEPPPAAAPNLQRLFLDLETGHLIWRLTGV